MRTEVESQQKRAGIKVTNVKNRTGRGVQGGCRGGTPISLSLCVPVKDIVCGCMGDVSRGPQGLR